VRRRTRRALRIAVGVALLVLGLAGLVLPVLQGLLFLFLGVVLLAPDVAAFRYLLRRLEARFPGLAERARRSRWWPGDDDA